MSVKGEKAVLNGRARRVHVQLVPFDSQTNFHFIYPRFIIVYQLSWAAFFLFLAFQQFKLLYLPGSPYSCNP